MFKILPSAGITQIRFKGSDVHPLSQMAPLVFIFLLHQRLKVYIHDSYLSIDCLLSSPEITAVCPLPKLTVKIYLLDCFFLLCLDFLIIHFIREVYISESMERVSDETNQTI